MLNNIRLILFHNTSQGEEPLNSVLTKVINDPFWDGKLASESTASSAYINNVQTEASDFMVISIPTLIITIEQNGEFIPVGRLVGGQITESNITEAMKQLIPFQSNGDGTFEGNGIVVGGGKELSFGGLGFDLFNLNINPFIIAGIMVVGGVQTYRNRDNNTKYLWGFISGIAGVNVVRNELGLNEIGL